jgi:hypothetical protein
MQFPASTTASSMVFDARKEAICQLLQIALCMTGTTP